MLKTSYAFNEFPFRPQIMNECNLVSTLLPAQEVASPLTAEPAFSQSLTSGQFSSLLHSTLGGFNFIFAGTNSGKLYQVRVLVKPLLLHDGQVLS